MLEELRPLDLRYLFLRNRLGRAITERGGKTWFFITADYSFGKDMEDKCAAAVRRRAARCLGSVRHPINTADFSSFLLQAQGSGADVIAFANAGGDTSGCFKQAKEFGIAPKNSFAAFTLTVINVPALGLATLAARSVLSPSIGTRTRRRGRSASDTRRRSEEEHAGRHAGRHVFRRRCI